MIHDVQTPPSLNLAFILISSYTAVDAISLSFSHPTHYECVCCN